MTYYSSENLRGEEPVEIVKFIMLPYRFRYHKPILRGMTVYSDHDRVENLKDIISDRRIRSGSISLDRRDIQQRVGSIVHMNTTPFKEASIVNGWDELRYIFLASFQGGEGEFRRVRVYLQGYTDYAPKLGRGNILPHDLRFYINSAYIVNYTSRTIYNQGRAETIYEPKITKSLMFLDNVAAAEDGLFYRAADMLQDGGRMATVITAKPDDIISGVADTHSIYSREYEDISDASTELGGRDRTSISNRANDSLLNYNSFVLNSYISGFSSSLDGFEHGGLNVFGRSDDIFGRKEALSKAISRTSTSSVTYEPLFRELKQLRNCNSVSDFTLGELELICTASQVASKLTLTQNEIRTRNPNIVTPAFETDHRIDPENYIRGGLSQDDQDIKIQSFVHNIHALMSSLFITSLRFDLIITPTMREIMIGAPTIEHEISHVVISDIETFFDGISIESVIEQLKHMIVELLSYEISFGLTETVYLSADITLLMDSIICVQYPNSSLEPDYYIVPTFADANFSTVLSNHNLNNSMIRNLRKVYDDIDDNLYNTFTPRYEPMQDMTDRGRYVRDEEDTTRSYDDTSSEFLRF